MLLEVVVLVILLVVIIHSFLLYSFGIRKVEAGDVMTSGTTVPSLKIETMDRETTRLPRIINENNYKVLCVVSPDCRYCKKIIPHLEEYEKKLSVSIALLFHGNQSQDIYKYIASNSIKLDSYLVSAYELKRKMNISSYPYIIIVNHQGFFVKKGHLYQKDLGTWLDQAKDA